MESPRENARVLCRAPRLYVVQRGLFFIILRPPPEIFSAVTSPPRRPLPRDVRCDFSFFIHIVIHRYSIVNHFSHFVKSAIILGIGRL